MLAARATSTLVAASQTLYANPTPSPSDGHVLHHGASTTAESSNSGGGDTGECKLLGSFSLLIQLALGGLALLSLVYKRWRERPQRPLKVWAFDVSKQVFGSAMLHLLNVLMSMFSAGQIEIRPQYRPNPCSFYLLNLGIDVSFPRYRIPQIFAPILNLWTDNTWNPDSHPHATRFKLDRLVYASSESTRINRVWKLRSSTQGLLVVQTVHHILYRITLDESLRLLHHSIIPVHR